MTIAPPPPPQNVPRDVEGACANVAEITALLEATITRVSALTDGERRQRVNDEWSASESLRHMTFVIDVWLGKHLKGEANPFHPHGMPPHFIPRKGPGSAIDPDADPTFEEVCDVLRGRLSSLEGFCAALTAEEMARPIEGHAKSVAGGLGVIFDELTFHNGFINRDLDLIDQVKLRP